jgi:hypothetical protein
VGENLLLPGRSLNRDQEPDGRYLWGRETKINLSPIKVNAQTLKQINVDILHYLIPPFSP